MPTVSCPRRTFARGTRIIRRCRRNAFRPSGLATTPTIDNGTQPRYSRALTFACTRGHGSGSIARRDKKLWELPGLIFLFRILFLWEERDWECFSRNLVMDLIRLGCVVYMEEVNSTCYSISSVESSYMVLRVIWYTGIVENFTEWEENLLREKKVSQTWRNPRMIWIIRD